MSSLKTQTKEEIRFTWDQINEFADYQSDIISVRKYVDGSSNDKLKLANKTEKLIVESAIKSGLNAIKENKSKRLNNTAVTDGILASCEYFVHAMQSRIDSSDEKINAYDSVYLPLRSFLAYYEEGE